MTTTRSIAPDFRSPSTARASMVHPPSSTNALGNFSPNRRRAFATRWLGDDAVYARRNGETSPPFPGLDERLKPGDPMAAEEFPLVIG